ncbi:MAG: metallophosphoesterase [Clostridia bacterium]|nr:metallophosphoesterase [Clostridia bacterium]
MSLFAIADLHLSTLEETNKSMEVFGHRWQDYMLRLKNNWCRIVREDDTVVIPGDISWALSLEEAVSDLKFIDSLPGRKILGKGNHDFWWMTMRKHAALFEREGIKSISFLFNNAHEADGMIIAGTRGWYHDEDAKNAPTNADFEKLVNRESLRLKASLEEAVRLRGDSDREIVVFMHFPPFWNGKASGQLVDILHEYSIGRVYFGHIHGNYTVPPSFEHEGIKMSLISADYLEFIPKRVLKEQI